MVGMALAARIEACFWAILSLVSFLRRIFMGAGGWGAFCEDWIFHMLASTHTHYCSLSCIHNMMVALHNIQKKEQRLSFFFPSGGKAGRRLRASPTLRGCLKRLAIPIISIIPIIIIITMSINTIAIVIQKGTSQAKRKSLKRSIAKTYRPKSREIIHCAKSFV